MVFYLNLPAQLLFLPLISSKRILSLLSLIQFKLYCFQFFFETTDLPFQDAGRLIGHGLTLYLQFSKLILQRRYFLVPCPNFILFLIEFLNKVGLVELFRVFTRVFEFGDLPFESLNLFGKFIILFTDLAEDDEHLVTLFSQNLIVICMGGGQLL
jgi:hypothetical protein